MPPRGDAEPLLTPSSPRSAGGDGHGAKFLLGGAAGPPGLRPEPLQHGHEEDAAQHLLQRVGAAGRCRDRPGHSRALPRRVGRRGQVRSCCVRCAPTAAASTHGCPWHGLGEWAKERVHVGCLSPCHGAASASQHGFGTPAHFGHPSTVWGSWHSFGTPAARLVYWVLPAAGLGVHHLGHGTAQPSGSVSPPGQEVAGDRGTRAGWGPHGWLMAAVVLQLCLRGSTSARCRGAGCRRGDGAAGDTASLTLRCPQEQTAQVGLHGGRHRHEPRGRVLHLLQLAHE